MKKYDFNDRLNKLITFDNIRLLKLAEIFQYNLLYIFFVFIFAHFIDKYYFNKFSLNEDYYLKREKSVFNFLQILIIVIIETFFLTILLFYIRKIVLLFPSIGSIYNKQFQPHTTLEYTMHIALVYIFFELIPNFRNRFIVLMKYFN